MNVLADESVDLSVVLALRADGHQVDYVAEMAPGLTDDRVLDGASDREALLLTADKDFGELVFRLRRVAAGVLLVRLSGLSPSLKARLVAGALRAHGNEMAGAFSVITPGLIRIRHKK